MVLINGQKNKGSGLAYFTLEKEKEITGKGPVGKF